jgi:hypothetical protein
MSARTPVPARAAQTARRAAIQPDWWSKTSAGAVFGFGLGIAASGLVAWIGSGGPWQANKYQAMMWLVVPIAIGVLALSYLFRRGWHAWLYLGLANALAFGLLAACRYFPIR